jgi:hypothetical protein
MAKEVNIHIKTTGAEQAKQGIRDVAQEYDSQLTSLRLLQFQAAGSAKQHTDELKNQETVLGRLGSSVKNYAFSWFSVTAILALVVGTVHKVISAFDDMKKAASDAVHELASQQRAAASFFEAMDAYSGPQRKAALAMAREVQARTGLPFEESKQLLEAQKRIFGEISQQSTDQFAAYWRLHAGAATTDLIRWMGESGAKTPERQGQIMRMISAVAKEGKITDEELIGPITARAARFKYMGWSPEQAITYTGKALAGLSASESSRVMRGLFESLEGFTEEEALKMKVPPKVAASEQARIEWLQVKVATMTPEQRRTTLKHLYGTMAPYVTKMLFEPTSTELQRALEYATTSTAAAEEQRRVVESQKTEEAQLEMTKGKAVIPQAALTPEKTTEVLIREQGKFYLEYLRIADRLKYERIKVTPGGEEYQYEIAAQELWRTIQPKKKEPGPAMLFGFPLPTTLEMTPVTPTWEDVSGEERMIGLEKAAQIININYYNDIIHTPRVGSDERGPRTPAGIK